MAADSTMLRMVNLLIALSLGVHREQLEQRMGLTWPRPFLLRPLKIVSQQVIDKRTLMLGILGCSLLDHDGLILRLVSGDRSTGCIEGGMRTEVLDLGVSKIGLSRWCRYRRRG